MSDYKDSSGLSKIYTTKDAVISSGQSLSGVVDLEQLNITGLLIPSSWTTAKITFQVSPDGTTFGDLNDASGNEIQLTVSAGKFIGVNLSELSGARFIKVRSGTSSVAVNQGADRTISLVLTNNAEASAGAGGGTTAATIADGADVAEGAAGDAAVAAGAAGTVSAKLRRISADLATLLAQTDGVEASLTSIDGKTVAGVANGQATMANSKPVAIASDQTAVAVKTSTNTGSAYPSPVFPVGLKDTSGNMQPFYNDSVGDAQPGVVVTPRMKNGELQRTPTTFKTFSGTVITSETTIWTPAAGKKFRIMGYMITQTATTGDITVRDNTAGTTILVIPAHTLGVVQISPNLGNGKLSAAANNVLTMQGASGEAISGCVFGTEE